MIPYKTINKSDLNEFAKNSMSDYPDMEVIEIRESYVIMRMPVVPKVKQPIGLLHGGAAAALAENVASLAGSLVVRPENKVAVGLSLNINHLKSVHEGYIYAKAEPVHLGKKTQVWEVKTSTDNGTLINVARMTLAVIKK